jgi:tRNA pseudouridine65 synthase
MPSGNNPTSRYSFVEAEPITGRMHQIRKHFARINHPIIGDRPHGCNKQNRFFKEKWNMTTMMLHASSITFDHPIRQYRITISANLSKEFLRTLSLLKLSDSN